MNPTTLTEIRRHAGMTNSNWSNLNTNSPWHYCVCCGDFIRGANTYDAEDVAPMCTDRKHHWKTFQYLVRRTHFDQFGNIDIDYDGNDTQWTDDMVNACIMTVEREWPVCLCDLHIFARLFMRDPSYFVMFISDRTKVPIYYQYNTDMDSVVDSVDDESVVSVIDTELDTDDDDANDANDDANYTDADEANAGTDDADTVVLSYRDRCPAEYDKQCYSMFAISTRNNLSWNIF